MTNLPYAVEKLEQEKQVTTNEAGIYNGVFLPISMSSEFLYHGIRFQKYLEKLESIFTSKKILAGKYIEGYMNYGDNCNKGEYVSLLKWMEYSNLEYRTFIFKNVSLVVSPLVDAIETKYVTFEDWLKIKDIGLKNIYSYMRGECLVKDYVPLDFVKAVGVPYTYLSQIGREAYANKLLDDIVALMEQYEIVLPIVDTSRYNIELVDIGRCRRFIKY